MTSDELKAAEAEWNQLMTNMNESRSLTSEEPLF